jgi:hypothetical protein
MHEQLREREPRSNNEERDYQVFLKEARKEEERAEIKAARQVNLSLLGGRV